MAIRKTRTKVPTYRLYCDTCNILLAKGYETKYEAQGAGVPYAHIVTKPKLRRLHLCNHCHPLRNTAKKEA